MASQTVEITSIGIRKILNKFTPEKAIAEFIWNGFDANATVVHIDFQIGSEELETYNEIKISDNGTGICYEELQEKFKRFHESHKSIINSTNIDLTRGKNGYGRFTFFKFAQYAKWTTSYKRNSNIVTYDIKINNDSLKDYEATVPVISEETAGTNVVFTEIDVSISPQFIERTLIPYLKAEFAWFLELKEEHKIIINGQELDYSSIIAETEDFDVTVRDKQGQEMQFNCKYIRWNRKMNEEYSKFYFLNSQLELKSTKTTLLNKKGDGFWHSVLVINDFFNEINCDNEDDSDLSNQQQRLFDNADDRKNFNELLTKLNDYLSVKRRPFLRKQAAILIETYENEKVFPQFGNEEWDKIRKRGLEDFVKNLYEVEPAVFTKLNKEQKRVFLELLNLVMDSGERESLFKIIDAVIELDSTDREELSKILETTRLKQVISTINLIKDRLLTLESLKEIVFNHELKANERNNLQKFIEKHYWIFGEEYRLVCSEEVKFEEALRKYLYILRGVDEKQFIEHPDKYKEMDLFLTGTNFRDGKPHNVVIEIKNPTTIKQLTSKEVTQIKTYIDVILKEDRFNDSNEFWSFFLIGQNYDSIVQDDIQVIETGLLRKKDNHCLYIKKWSEIINEVDRRMKYLLDKLKIERAYLSTSTTLDNIMNDITNNSAVMQQEN